jgi:hypothetical protein
MAYGLIDDSPEVPIVNADEVVEALAADGADQPFAEGIGLSRQLRPMRTV